MTKKIVIKNLVFQSADIAICDLTQNYRRSQVIDFTRAYNLVPLTFVTVKPGLKSKTWITVQPFTAEVWICTLFSLILMSGFAQLLQRKWIVEDRSVDSTTISLVGALLQQCNMLILHMKILSKPSIGSRYAHTFRALFVALLIPSVVHRIDDSDADLQRSLLFYANRSRVQRADRDVGRLGEGVGERPLLDRHLPAVPLLRRVCKGRVLWRLLYDRTELAKLFGLLSGEHRTRNQFD